MAEPAANVEYEKLNAIENNAVTHIIQYAVDKKKVLEWIKKGAQPSFTVRKLLGKIGVLKPLDLESLPKRSPKGKEAEAAAEAKSEAKPAEGAKEAPKAETAPKEEKKEAPKAEAPPKEEKKEAPKAEVAPKEEKKEDPKAEAPPKEEKKEEAVEKQNTEPPK